VADGPAIRAGTNGSHFRPAPQPQGMRTRNCSKAFIELAELGSTL